MQWEKSFFMQHIHEEDITLYENKNKNEYENI
jgi:hypothetical protein